MSNGEVTQVGAVLEALNTAIPGAPTTDSPNDELQGISAAVVAGTGHREKVYPYDSLGIEVTPGNMAWGGTFVLVPIDGVTDDYGWDGGSLIEYNLIAIEAMIKAVGGVGDAVTWQILRIGKATEQVLDADALLGQKVIPVPLTGDFLADDWVWIVDDDTAGGELAQIDTIQTDTSLTVKANLVANYTTAQNAKVYLGRRKDAANAYTAMWGKFAHASVNEMMEHRFHAPRSLASGDGLIIRAWGIENADPVACFSIVFDAH